jgi:alkylation response protein AidB-like acyl-CoA dehydrogenase
MAESARRVLSEDLLKTLHSRAADYDRANRFFAEDVDDLREVGYLRAAIPEERGGLGLTLAEVNLEQRRLAYWAPSTALGITVHLYWTGPAGDLARAGDPSLDWLVDEIVAGKVLAAGHGEPGNDTALDDSLTSAVPVEGGYLLSGHKIFTSLSPAWDWLGIHARDDSDPEHPRIVHGLVSRDAGGVRTVQTWDTLPSTSAVSWSGFTATSAPAHFIRRTPTPSVTLSGAPSSACCRSIGGPTPHFSRVG